MPEWPCKATETITIDIGVIITVTLGMGLVWFAIPPIFLDICWRAR